MAGGISIVRAVVVVCAVVLLLPLPVAEGLNVVMLEQGDGEEGDGYFPLARALSSVTRLAVEHVGEAAAAAAAAPGSNVTLSTEAVAEGIGAVAGLCLALGRDDDTVAVRKGFVERLC